MSNGLDSIVETPQTFSKRVMPVAAMALLAMMVVAMLAVASPAQAATTFEVNSTGDQPDVGITDDVCDADPAAAATNAR